VTDRRRRVARDRPTARPDDAELATEIAKHYPQLGRFDARLAYSSVHDVAFVDAHGSWFALKLYRPGVRSTGEVEWEVALHRHLRSSGAPVAELVPGSAGFIEVLSLEGVARMAVLSERAPGRKPGPSEATCRLLGHAAAAIHVAADDFTGSYPKATRTVDTEVHQQLVSLRPVLERIHRWDEVAELGEFVARSLPADLERGICHNDLTLDNVHVHGHGITVFDFDSAGEHWRAAEPQGVFHAAVLAAKPWWDAWRAGYTEVRPMSSDDQRAVPYFVLMYQFENTAWKLGLTPTSIGQLLRADELGQVVDEWRRWADTHCARS
jgi:Ser/Thr protein kinase RdoA (MazF antagonist)